MHEGLYAIDGGKVGIALPEKTAKGGTRPGHVWVPNAMHDYICEGLTPFLEDLKRRYALGCMRVIRKGERYLRKTWTTRESCEVSSRHCVRCAPIEEKMPGRVRTERQR